MLVQILHSIMFSVEALSNQSSSDLNLTYPESSMGGDLRGLGDAPQNFFRWETAHAFVPPIL